ncbi:hypothetical protein PINS_up024019 [Pythium insidiosum]|nr:hypothetical protein PINS_up024019 [Pythium insidiosum]
MANSGAEHERLAVLHHDTRQRPRVPRRKHTIFARSPRDSTCSTRSTRCTVDKDSRPYQDVRIKHTYILEDPFPDPPLLEVLRRRRRESAPKKRPWSEVIRDYKTGDSLCYAFIEFQDKRHCEEAYFKMNNVLLDDRRIKVDFSQSVSKLWNNV